MRLVAGPNTGLGTWPARRARISPDRTGARRPASRAHLRRAGRAHRPVRGRAASARRRPRRPRGVPGRQRRRGVRDVLRRLAARRDRRAAELPPLRARRSATCSTTPAPRCSCTAPTPTRWSARRPAGQGHRARRAPGAAARGALDYEAEIAAGPVARRGAAGRAGRPRPDPLHLGHDGPPQGRGADPRQHDLEHRQLPRPRRRAEHRPGAVHRPAVPLRRARPGHAAHAVQGRERRACCRRPTPAWCSQRVSAARITSFSAVPTMLQMMCEHPSWDAADLSSLTLVQYGGSPVQERVARAWLDRGVRLLQGYGMTEASPGVYMGTHDGTQAHPTRSGCRTSSPTSPCCATAGPEPVAGQPAELAGPRAARVRRLLEPPGGDGGALRRRRSGSAPATCCGSTTTAGRTSSTGSRTCTSPAGRTCTPPRWRPSRPSWTRWPTAPSSGSPTPGGARSASPTCSCAKGPR